MTNFRGIYVPLMTPLTQADEVDVPSLKRLIHFLLEGGIDGLWVLGATGQFHTLSERQRDIVTDVAIEAAAGKVPVLIGCIDSSPDRCVERARHAKAAGADGIFATAPIFDAVTQVEVLAHFRHIRESVDLPLVAYNAFYATQTPFAIETVAQLAEEGTLAGIKDSADVPEFRRLLVDLRRLPDFSIFTGHTYLADAAFMMGAAGCVPTLGNLIPETYAGIRSAAERGDWASARSLQDEAVAVGRIVSSWEPQVSIFGNFLGAAKTFLQILGVIECANPGRPYPLPTSEQQARVRATMKQLGILKKEA
ncbi:MAG: dihydrodipicolinate synthase family protein [Acidobacteriota bacterium]